MTDRQTEILKRVLEHYTDWLLQSGLLAEGYNHDKLTQEYLLESVKERFRMELQAYRIQGSTQKGVGGLRI